MAESDMEISEQGNKQDNQNPSPKRLKLDQSAKIEKDIEDVEKEIKDVEKEIKDVEKEIKDVEKDIKDVEYKIEKTGNAEKKNDLRKKENHLRKKEDHLRENKRQLRENKRQLREKEILYLRMHEKRQEEMREQEKRRREEIREREKRRQEVMKAKYPSYPSIGNMSPSEYASKSGNPVSKVPLYYLNFAVDLYDEMCTYTTSKLSSYPGLDARVDAFFKDYKAFRQSNRDPPKDHPYMKGENMLMERSLTAMFARALDRFLFGNMDSNGACYHQMTTRKNLKGGIEACDICVMRLKNNMPHSLVVVGDFKPTDRAKADVESHGYAITTSQDIYRNCDRPVMITLPATLDHIMLNVYTSWTQCIEVACTETTDEDNFKRFSYILFEGVHRLLKNEPLIERFRFKVCCDNEHQPLDHQHQQQRFYRVFKCFEKNIVLKFFNDHHFLPKIEVLKELYSELQYDLRHVTSDGKLKCLVCKFLQSSEENIQNVHVIELLKTLDKLHKRGYVHSDIRTTNIIFCDSTAYFIDFDLMDLEDTKYPPTYNHINIEERHPSACAFMERKKAHDRYSLYRVLIPKIQHFTLEQQRIIKQINHDSSKELGEIIQQLENV